MRAIPLDPGQALARGVGHGRCVEIGALDQHFALALETDAHQAMQHRAGLVALLHRQQRLPGRYERQVAITAEGASSQRLWLKARRSGFSREALWLTAVRG